MSDKFNQKKELYAGDAYRDCANDLEQLILSVGDEPAKKVLTAGFVYINDKPKK